MDAVMGALLAAVVAWLSIAVVVAWPRLRIRPHPVGVRIVGAVTLALFALQILGWPVPSWLPLTCLGGGLVLVVIIAPRGHAAAA